MMNDFQTLRDQLTAIRSQQEAARQQSAAAQERLHKLQRELNTLDRSFDPQNGAQVEQRQSLQQQIERAEDTLNRRKKGLLEVSGALDGIYADFTPFTDPRQMIGQFQDRFPILLMPLRIETRFKTFGAPVGAVGQRHQLWVRVYPDDCWVDRFEATLSETEILAGRRFWQDIWAAAGDETLERAAWRGLVSSVGSGRGAWVTRTYQPENMAELPSRVAPSDVFLVVSNEEPFSAAERLPIAAYWSAVWRAGDDLAQSEAAFNTLVAALGQPRAEEIATQYVPSNLSTQPLAPLGRDEIAVTVVFIDWPPPAQVDSKARSWSQASRVNLLPERLVVIGYQGQNTEFEVIGNAIPSPLIVGPDPAAPAEEQLQPKDGDLLIPEPMQWMIDFEKAVQVGMGFRIDLTPEQARRGFDRLIVLGVRLSADAPNGQSQLETLFEHHHYSRQGLKLLPQGTPTNNTEKGGAGYNHGDDADATFETHYKGTRRYTPQADPMLRQDGQWLADYLGISPQLVQRLSGNDGTDQLEARAMNVALWSGTWGYMLDTMMNPIIRRQDIAATRQFFTQFVSGRGTLPAIQIGKQPYGILPTTVYSQMRWFARLGNDIPGTTTHVPQGRNFLARLWFILNKIDLTWSDLASQVAHVGKSGGDAHRNLLDVVGLHSGAVEYHQRHAESIDHLYNMMNIYGLGGQFWGAFIAAAYIQSGKNLLTELGYTGDETPDILERLFLSRQNLLQGPVIDDVPLSESVPVRVYTPDNRNYLQWLIDSAGTSLDTLRRQQGFTDNKSPKALLYIMLRYSLMQSYWETSLRLYELANVFTMVESEALRRQSTFLHVQEAIVSQATGFQSESRFAQLYATSPQITGTQDRLVADHITRLIPVRDNTPQAIATAELYEQMAALEHLKSIPTARLERLFAEHIDLCSYRLDAWQQGFLNLQLSRMRFSQGDDAGDNEDGVTRGVYLGAYGWIENLRPENKVMTPVELRDDLHKVFNADPKAPPLMRDSTNGGHIHTPSLNQAVTAAILRNGYLANATPSNPDTLAVNLSSDRVRRALGLIEGIRAGQSLGALLGYQFERGLHDRHNQAEVDEFIYDLRKAFPLVARRLRRTAEPEDTSIEALEARNVLDGLKLIEHIRKTGNKTYPFGKTLPAATPAQAAAINAEVERMLDSHDAVADVAIAESVHQAAMGNYDRAAGTLDTYSKGNFPPIPDVIQTPRSGINLTHRVGLHLPVGVDPDVSPIVGLAITPRSQGEANANSWLSTMLPAPADVACTVTITDPITGVEVPPITITQFDLGLQPLDLLFLLNTTHRTGMTELDDRILRHAISVANPRTDAAMKISYTTPVAGKITFFSLMPLVESCKQLLLASRPLLPSDIKLHNEATKAGDEIVTLERTRITTAQTNLSNLRADFETYRADLQLLFDDVTTNRATLINSIETLSADMIALLERAARAAVPQSGWGFIYDRRSAIYNRLLTAIHKLVDRWSERLTQFDAALTAYDALPAPTPDEVEGRFTLLIQAEQMIVTLPTNPLPATPADYRTALTAPAGPRARFADKLSDFEALLTSTANLPTLLGEASGLLPVSDFDFEPVSFVSTEDEIILLADDFLGMAGAQVTTQDKRLAAAQAQLDAHDAATKPTDQVKALQEAAKALFGNDFRMIPSFILEATHAAELQNATNASSSLLTYLQNDLSVDFPVDDWFYSAARVREKLHHWERILFLTEGFGTSSPTLQPIQLPYKADDRWLALEYPADLVIDGDRLLYTAHYSVPFNSAAPQCGVLVDEWTEVIPGTTEDTGITFHYDRPNAEPPQTMLLVTPPVFAGEWDWQNLVQSLHETLAQARKRAVEPAQVDATAYARFLPATVMSVTYNNLAITANLAVNNAIFEYIAGGNS
jgi:hypothetical protein